MSDFRFFQTNKKAKFLNKAKEVKAKREDDVKRIQSIILIQKNIRAFMMFRRNDSPQYPAFIRDFNKPHNSQFIQSFWNQVENTRKILKMRFMNIAIEENHSWDIMNPNLKQAIISYSQQNQLKCSEYQTILKGCWNELSTSYLKSCFVYPNFREALGILMTSNIHALMDLIIKFQDIQIINQMISIYLTKTSSNELEIEIIEDEERILKSYYNAVAILNMAITKELNINALIQIVSIIVQKLKKHYTDRILQKYKIDRRLYQSISLKEEIEQTLREKRQWEQYEGHLYHLCNLLPNILFNYIYHQQKSLSYALDILIEVTKLSESVISISITTEQFFILVEKLNSKGLFGHRQESINNYYECLIMILMLQKYLQGLNDLKFIEQFKYVSDKLKDAIRTYVLKFMKNLITFNSNFSILHEIIKHSIAFLNNLYNKIFRTNLIKTTVFEDSSINIFEGNFKYSNYGNANYLKELMKIVERCPYLLPIEIRFMVFRRFVADDVHYGHQNSSITVHRGREFEDAFKQLYHRNIKSRLHIRFINQYGQEEMGMDAGGLTKEFLTRIFKIAFSPKFGRFIENEKKELLPNPVYFQIEDSQIAREYEFIGRLLGKSLYQNIMLGMKFAGPFLNLLINNKNCFDDLLQIDSALYKSLLYIVEMKEGVQDLELTFQYEDNLTKRKINLKPEGSKLKVNTENKMQYVNLLINYKVNRSIERQTRYIRKGLKSIINQNWIRMFNYGEFNYLLSGTGVIDVNDWMKYAKVSGNGQNHGIIEDFWEIVYTFTEEEKSLLLKFVTSCQRPSFLGFKDLSPPFTIRLIQKDDSMLPVSHTCGNILDLPEYSNKKVMREKLLYAIKSEAGFQMG